jgi:hypothetical protein
VHIRGASQPFISSHYLIKHYPTHVRMRSTFTFLAALVATAAAKKCINQTVPVKISSRNGVFNLAVPQTNLDAVEFVLNMTQQGRNYTDSFDWV